MLLNLLILNSLSGAYEVRSMDDFTNEFQSIEDHLNYYVKTMFIYYHNKLFRLSKEIFFKLLRCIIPKISLFNVTGK